MIDKKIAIFKALVETPGRIPPVTSEPLIEGTSLHREDIGFILGELQLRRRVDLIPNEEPAAAANEEEPAKKAETIVFPVIVPPEPGKKDRQAKRERLKKKAAKLKAELEALDAAEPKPRKPA